MSDGEGGAAGVHDGPDPATGDARAAPAVSMDPMRQGFMDFFDAEYHQVVRFLMLNGAGRWEAEDAAQQAFTRGWIKVRRAQWPLIDSPRAWIRAVALNEFRTQRGNPAPTDRRPEKAGSGPGHAELTGQALDVVSALNRVEDENARAVVALDLDDIPGPEIAAMLGVTEQKVRDLRKKARRTLKRHLSPPGRPSAETARPGGVEGRDGR
ncbi:sigma-70 family RNA polymerase sigma factor [Actinoallomurus iriomotensis]|uniref:Uncharacterized protein n=1 Tax=Actinoallomurus iriomotensis TaxID=478107 RepID=A0A9W6S3R9_9ACTN|nr:sigma-70 family RNA polymerase sigma factor [Actinoallomurus iriomotensis]GLY87630.1 hypothetical protein Airi02_055590 [Actinoallomurus iriomotensis]